MEKATDHKDKLDHVYQKLEDGDISVIEAIQKSNILTAEMAMAEAIDGANEHGNLC